MRESRMFQLRPVEAQQFWPKDAEAPFAEMGCRVHYSTSNEEYLFIQPGLSPVVNIYPGDYVVRRSRSFSIQNAWDFESLYEKVPE